MDFYDKMHRMSRNRSRSYDPRLWPRRMLGIALIGAMGALGFGGLKAIHDADRAAYEQDQQAAAAILEPALKRLGEQALASAMAPKGGGFMGMEKDDAGNYVLTFTSDDVYNQGEGTVVMAPGSNGRPDPNKTLYVNLHTLSDYHWADVTVVAPGGQQYDLDKSKVSGYEGRLRTAVDLDGDGEFDVARVLDTAQRRTTYGTPAGEQAVGVAEFAEREIQILIRGANPPAAA